MQATPSRLLDAYTSGNGSVVTRLWQNNTTQTWCFTLDNDDGVDKYTIQHRSYSGQYLGAYESCCDHDVVLRDAQNNASQYWYVEEPSFTAVDVNTNGSTPNPVVVRLKQSSTWRYLDAYTSSNDYQAVTRAYQSNATQDWYVVPEP